MCKKWMNPFVVLMALLIAFFPGAYTVRATGGTTYYVSFVNGNDSNNGISSSTPWKTFSKVSGMSFSPGDTILLECGNVWTEGLVISSSGSSANPISLSSYGSGPRPKIIRNYSSQSGCITLTNASGWDISNIEMSNAEQGIRLAYSNYSGDYLHINNCYFHDITAADPGWSIPNGTWGCAVVKPNNSSNINDIQMINCIADNCDGFYGVYNDTNVLIDGCTTQNIKYNTIASLDSGYIQYCVFSHNGGQSTIPVGGTDIMESICNGVTIRFNEFGNRGRYQNDPDGCAIDYEGADINMTVEYNFIHDSAGSGVFLFFNTTSPSESTGVLVDHNLFYHNSQNYYGSNYGEIAKGNDYPNVKPTGAVSNNTYYTLPGMSFTPNEVQYGITKSGNNAGTLSFVDTPATSISGGSYNSTQSITLSCSTSGATIRYTLDGSMPTSSSTQYTGTPIAISQTTCLNAKAFKNGMEYSPTNTQIYRIDPLGPGTQLLTNSGFESPAVSTYQYGPFTNGWTFDSASGVQHNGSAWGGSNAPEGVQTAFLSSNGTIQQSVNFSSGGYYRICFDAARRASWGGTESFDVYCDNNVIGKFTPASYSFTEYYTNTFYASSGSHTIKFAGTNPGDNTDFIDNIVLWKLPLYQASTQFSLTQGTNQWYYMSKSGSTYTNMTVDSYYGWWRHSSQATCVVASNFQHPETSDSARAWMAPYTGTVQITCSGNIRLANTGSDGTYASIYKNSSLLWGPQLISNQTGISFPPLTVMVDSGDMLYFVLNRNVNSNYDATYWDPIIAYTDMPVVSNAGFETPTLSTYQYGPFTDGWMFDYASGVQHNGSAWGASNAPEGVQTAFLASIGSIQQNVYFPCDGSYKVAFSAAKRTTWGGTESFKVYYDNTLIGTYTPSSGSFSDFLTDSFTASSGNHIIKFIGQNSGDNTDFIDNVSIITQY